jgi:hypothetical protein
VFCFMECQISVTCVYSRTSQDLVSLSTTTTYFKFACVRYNLKGGAFVDYPPPTYNLVNISVVASTAGAPYRSLPSSPPSIRIH